MKVEMKLQKMTANNLRLIFFAKQKRKKRRYLLRQQKLWSVGSILNSVFFASDVVVENNVS